MYGIIYIEIKKGGRKTMKINGRFAVVGYAVTVRVSWEENHGIFIDDDRIISFCLDRDFAIEEYNKLTIDDFLSEEEKDAVVEVTAYLEVWKMSDSPNDFSRDEELWKFLD